MKNKQTLPTPTLVFPFGAAGSGKSTLLAGLFHAIQMNRFAITYLNSYEYKDFFESPHQRIFNSYTRNLKLKKAFPEPTTSFFIGDYLRLDHTDYSPAHFVLSDIPGSICMQIAPDLNKDEKPEENKQKASQKQTRFTKSEISKEIENSQKIAESKVPEKNVENRGALPGPITDNLMKPVPSIALLVGTISNPERDDFLLARFLQYIQEMHLLPELQAMALVIAQQQESAVFDKEHKTQEFYEWLQQHYSQTLHALDAIEDTVYKKTFPLYMQIKSETGTLKEESTKEIQAILNWIMQLYLIPEEPLQEPFVRRIFQQINGIFSKLRTKSIT